MKVPYFYLLESYDMKKDITVGFSVFLFDVKETIHKYVKCIKKKETPTD